MRNRFIDLAQHGGCSRKVDGLRLEQLLNPTQPAGVWLDAGSVVVSNTTFTATVDVVLPMIDDPALFGKIVVAHVLSDIYAAGAEPIFAMNILGLPGDGPSDDPPIREMLASAADMISSCGAMLLGGHSIENRELLFGLSATGKVVDRSLSPRGANPGDVVVVTKPLGTGIATILWKDNKARIQDFEDVVDGMTNTNERAARVLSAAGATSCTDVTGYGLMGHLHNMLRASKRGAEIDVSALPAYLSIEEWIDDQVRGTRLLEANEDFVLGVIEMQDGNEISHLQRLLLFDAQVSGGLLATIPPGNMDRLNTVANELNQRYWEVGVITAPHTGRIRLRGLAKDRVVA
jgi:selenide,water dikinase